MKRAMMWLGALAVLGTTAACGGGDGGPAQSPTNNTQKGKAPTNPAELQRDAEDDDNPATSKDEGSPTSSSNGNNQQKKPSGSAPKNPTAKVPTTPVRQPPPPKPPPTKDETK
jgi:hypothetical protein